MRRTSIEGFTLIELLIVVAIIGIVASIAIPNLLNAVDRSKQKRTMADLRTIGTSIETYSIDNNQYPAANNIGTLMVLLGPGYLTRNLTTDGWNNALSVASVPTRYTVCSGGKDGGVCVNDANGVTHLFVDSITYADGRFVQWPEGDQR